MPESGSSVPARIFNNVDFPEPDGPTQYLPYGDDPRTTQFVGVDDLVGQAGDRRQEPDAFAHLFRDQQQSGAFPDQQQGLGHPAPASVSGGQPYAPVPGPASSTPGHYAGATPPPVAEAPAPEPAAAAPKKSVDATRPAETEVPAAEAAGPVRTGSSSSSSSSDAEKKEKKKATKSKSRSASRKRASIFGGLLGKKDKADEPIPESEATKEESVAPQIGETSTTAPVITSDIPKTGDELNAEATPAPVVAETAVPAPIETETAAPVVAPAPVEKDDKTLEKPKPTKP